VPGLLNEQNWETLLDAVDEERCTPFLGSGACVPGLPTGAGLALEWSDEHGYPLTDREDLARVAEFIGIKKEAAMEPKHAIVRRFGAGMPPDFKNDPDDPHAVLATLPISVYVTTNYVDWMAQALDAQNRKALVEFCRWNDEPALRYEKIRLTRAFKPTRSEPVVYHLHGHVNWPQSLVLTESDYVDFLIAIQRRGVVPHQIERALANASLVFVGYSFADWDFRVIHRGLVAARNSSLRELGVTVQLTPKDKDAENYLDRYFDERKLRVFWGTAREFAAELKRRHDERHSGL
jgi:SIR2-like domain